MVIFGVYTPTAFGNEPYHLGVALGLSGSGAFYSEEVVEAIEIAINEINTQGGLLGRHPIRLFIRDTRTDPDVAKEVVSKLIQSKTPAMLVQPVEEEAQGK